MKKRSWLWAFIGAALVIAAGLSMQAASSDQPKPVPVKKQAIKPVQAEGQIANTTQQGEGGQDSSDIYMKLRELAKSYRDARSKDDRQNIASRINDLMEKFFTTSLQREQRRIEMEEQRLKAEIEAREQRLNHAKEALTDRQAHMMDLVHDAVQRLLDTGEMPEMNAPGE